MLLFVTIYRQNLESIHFSADCALFDVCGLLLNIYIVKTTGQYNGFNRMNDNT